LAESYATYSNGQLISSGSTLLNDPFEYDQLTTAHFRPLEGMSAGIEKDDDFLTAILERGMPPSGTMRIVVAPCAVATDHPDATDTLTGARTYA
jgi:hypothetical protein